VADDKFEEKGVKQIKAGKGYYDEVVNEKGKTYLRAMTAIPVVMDKCVMCHPNYKSAKKGEAIGALTYKASGRDTIGVSSPSARQCPSSTGRCRPLLSCWS
jgi:hypothetical protein